MIADHADANLRPQYDIELTTLADYVVNHDIRSELAYETAYHCLLDALGCGILALRYPDCKKMLGPSVPEMTVTNGTPIPGTQFKLDPVQAAFNIGTLVRWLDFNDTWLAAEWGHPSDNLGAILAAADYQSRNYVAEEKPPLVMKDILTAMIKAYEIQGVLALENSFNRVGFDHVILVKVASIAIATQLLGGNRDMIINAISQAWLDGGNLRTYRHAPNTGSRKSWAAGDATSRAVWLALMTLRGEMGYPSALTAKKWGFYDVCFRGQAFKFARPLDANVMENILFKISFPAEFHAQTAVEGAVQLHPEIKDRLDQIEKIVLTTHESAIRIISKTGPLYNVADRDHCLQYMTAIGLIYGDLKADHYSDAVAKDPRIDALRKKMLVQEDKQFSKDYLDPDKRSIANSIQIYFRDGSKTATVRIDYPIGHRRRREAGIPLLLQKFKTNLATHFSAEKTAQLTALFAHRQHLEKVSVSEFLAAFSD